ncbi:hypothetical protein LSM04_004170 [Trypanosoma melophagium]|uniref:uncharacterized protein n=1 Tax=Trypanosoma melophagium TaxID=715481 RepID=UPI003519EB54|nr:hypothetical protein LSM04_004170 [Trypanosoma melophagium]
MPDSLTLKYQNLLTRVVAQERENVLLHTDLKQQKELAEQSEADERTVLVEVERSVQNVLCLCLMLCGTHHSNNAESIEAIESALKSNAEEEAAAVRALELYEKHTRTVLLSRRSQQAEKLRELGCEDEEEYEKLQREAAAAAAKEEEEIAKLENMEIMELERRTELASLQYVRDFFNVHV